MSMYMTQYCLKCAYINVGGFFHLVSTCSFSVSSPSTGNQSQTNWKSFPSIAGFQSPLSPFLQNCSDRVCAFTFFPSSSQRYHQATLPLLWPQRLMAKRPAMSSAMREEAAPQHRQHGSVPPHWIYMSDNGRNPQGHNNIANLFFNSTERQH